MVDVPVMLAELEFLTATPAAHHQGFWLEDAALFPGQQTGCGTIGCIAGNAILHAGRMCGRTAVYPNTARRGYFPTSVLYWPDTIDEDASPHSRNQAWQSVGAEVLGLTAEQATALFDGRNTLAQLWRMASAFSGGEIVVPERFREVSA